MWFEKLTGFVETRPDAVRANLEIDGTTLRSKINGASYNCGRLETPNLAELRQRIQNLPTTEGRLPILEVVANVQHLHIRSDLADSFFQAASQFNLLEMVGPSVRPEDGVDRYEFDYTQGPACAIACGAGTIYRNYFAPHAGQIGQTNGHQIDCLADIGEALGNTDNQLWKMTNGYALATPTGLQQINAKLKAMNEVELDELRQKLRIGLQWNTQVTIDECTHTVTQAYCSAVPVAYSSLPSADWSQFAQLVLEASYEATLCAALLNYHETGNNKVYLTLLGGGAFGNQDAWIFDALERAVSLFTQMPLQIAIVSYGAPQEAVRNFITKLNL